MFYWFCLYWLSILGGSIKILQLAKGIWLSLMSFAIIGLWCRTRLHQGGRIDSHHSVAPGNHSEECHPPAHGGLGRWSPLSKWEDRHQELHPGNQGSLQLHEPPQPHQLKALKFQMMFFHVFIFLVVLPSDLVGPARFGWVAEKAQAAIWWNKEWIGHASDVL